MRKVVLLLVFALFSVLINGAQTSAATTKPSDILKKKYPNEIVKQVKSTDINNDKKTEHFILCDSGNFYFINSKGVLSLVNTGILSDDGFPNEKIQIYSVSKNEKHVAVSFYYGPSNHQMYVYRLKSTGLVKVLSIMGDQGINIDAKGKIHMFWKKYREEGGWDTTEAIYSWSTSALKYKVSGTYQ